MFNTRLKQWNICKNYRAEEKEALAAHIAAAHLENRSVSNLTFKDRPVKLDRVLRHLRTKRRGNTSSKKTVTRSKRVLVDDGSGSDSSTSGATTSTDDSAGALQSTRRAPITVSLESGMTTSTILTPSTETEETYEVIEHEDAIGVAAEPTPPLLPPKGALNTEVILYQTQAYYQHIIGINGCSDSFPAPPAKLFWTNVKTGIYFLKKQSPALAWPLLNDACVQAADVFSYAPMLFLSQVLTVLSPVNTRVCPQVRNTLMRYLGGMAGIKLQSAQHPLAVILRELALDNSHGEASEKALDLTLSLFMQNFGTDHSATFAVYRSLITLLRRDKRLDLARQHGEQLVDNTQRALFSRPNLGYQNKAQSLSMVDLCTALTELIHIYIDLEQYGLAKAIASSVIQNYMLIQGVSFPDDQAAYALEDMAEICSRMGNMEEAAEWLRQAVDASSMLRGRTNAITEHISHKLQQVTEIAKQKLSQIEGLACGSLATEDHPPLLSEGARGRAFEVHSASIASLADESIVYPEQAGQCSTMNWRSTQPCICAWGSGGQSPCSRSGFSKSGAHCLADSKRLPRL